MSESPGRRAAVTILIAEDSKLMRKLIQSSLNKLGLPFEFREAENGEDAWARLQQDPPDLLLLDLHMPVMTGLELMLRLHEQGSTLPVIIISSDTNPRYIQDALDLGARGVINKPFKFVDLYRLFRTVMPDVFSATAS
jgi:CheY-like chemotaxis protein